MLPEEEKNHIRAEEILRLEIRQEIEKERGKRSTGKGLWSLVNSSFGVWFLSSVVLGGLTFGYRACQQRSAEITRKTETERRLKVEISGRVSNGLTEMRRSARRIERGEKQFTAFDYYFQARNLLDNRFHVSDYPYDFSTYPEYKERSFRALTFELRAITGQPGLIAIQEARADYERLVDLADDAEKETNVRTDASLGAVNKSIEILEHLQANPFMH
jgi:hypothetical protein